MKDTLLRTPVIGSLLRIGSAIAHLPRTLGAMQEQLNYLRTQSDMQSQKLDAAATHNEAFRTDTLRALDMANIRLTSADHRLLLLEQTKGTKPGKAVASEAGERNLTLADDHTLDAFYVAFENRFRGSEKDITERLQVYLPYFKKAKLDFNKYPVLDIGCGRGEMLSLLNTNGVHAVGMDLNSAMVARAREHGFEVAETDALSHLLSLPDNSLSAITGFHIVEHIPFAELVRIFNEAFRVLQPGGFVVFETPNPENVQVGSASFYYDPSHLNPIPPHLLAFTLETAGFGTMEIKPLHPARDDLDTIADPLVKAMAYKMYGPQDYAVIGYKSDTKQADTTKSKAKK
jgi:SAM-dependent methyltransferase